MILCKQAEKDRIKREKGQMNMRRILPFLLAVVMIFSLCSAMAVQAAAAEDHEHDWAKATCTEPKTCKICGATDGEPKGHKVEDWKTTQKATCTEGGIKTGKCERCGETVEKETDPKGHEPGEKWKTIQEPTDSDRTLIRVKYCERCGAECKREEKQLSDKEYKSWYKEHCSTIAYKKLVQSPEKYEECRIKIGGRVLQVMDSGSGYVQSTVLRVATKGRYDNVFYVRIYGSTKTRSLEGDKISLWGEYTGVYTYQSIFGQSITIPSMTAEYYSVK